MTLVAWDRIGLFTVHLSHHRRRLALGLLRPLDLPLRSGGPLPFAPTPPYRLRHRLRPAAKPQGRLDVQTFPWSNMLAGVLPGKPRNSFLPTRWMVWLRSWWTTGLLLRRPAVWRPGTTLGSGFTVSFTVRTLHPSPSRSPGSRRLPHSSKGWGTVASTITVPTLSLSTSVRDMLGPRS